MTFVIVSTSLLIIAHMSRTVIAYTGSDCDSQSYYKPHPTECALFYQCSPNGTYVLHTCPPDLHFNPILDVCDFPDEARCSNDYTVDPGDGEFTTSDPDTSTTVDAPEKCNTGDYLPHETECDAFYRCISGSFFLIYCPDGMQFNMTFKGCEVQENGCNEDGRSSVSTEITTTEISTTDITTDVSSDPSTDPSTEDSSTVSSTDDFTNSSTDYTTDALTDSTAGETTDVDTTTEVETTTKADTTIEAETTTESDITTEGDTTIETEPTTEVDTTTEAETTTTTETESTTDAETTTEACVNNEYKPDESDCEAFYRCINGRFVKLYCSIGMHFDPNSRLCVDPDVAVCNLETTNSPQVTTTTDISTSSTTEISTEIQITIVECHDNEYQPDESDCEAFYRCINGRFVKLYCSIGMHFDLNTRLCVEPELSGCGLASSQSTTSPDTTTIEISTETDTETSSVECASDEYRPDESNCQAFYRCRNGQFVRVFCPGGRHYNPSTQLCANPNVAGCELTVSVYK